MFVQRLQIPRRMKIIRISETGRKYCHRNDNVEEYSLKYTMKSLNSQWVLLEYYFHFDSSTFILMFLDCDSIMEIFTSSATSMLVFFTAMQPTTLADIPLFPIRISTDFPVLYPNGPETLPWKLVKIIFLPYSFPSIPKCFRNVVYSTHALYNPVLKWTVLNSVSAIIHMTSLRFRSSAYEMGWQ